LTSTSTKDYDNESIAEKLDGPKCTPDDFKTDADETTPEWEYYEDDDDKDMVKPYHSRSWNQRQRWGTTM
jgi:hypothetical protein